MAPTPSYYGPGSSQGDYTPQTHPSNKESPPSYTHPRNHPQFKAPPDPPIQVYNYAIPASPPREYRRDLHDEYHSRPPTDRDPKAGPRAVEDHHQQLYQHQHQHREGKFPRPGGNPPPPPSSYGGGGGGGGNGNGQGEDLRFYTGTDTTTTGTGTTTTGSNGYYTDTSGRRVKRKEEKKRGKDVAVGCCAGCAAACCCCGACAVM